MLGLLLPSGLTALMLQSGTAPHEDAASHFTFSYPAPFSTFQLIAGGAAPDRPLLQEIEEVVTSFRSR